LIFVKGYLKRRFFNPVQKIFNKHSEARLIKRLCLWIKSLPVCRISPGEGGTALFAGGSEAEIDGNVISDIQTLPLSDNILLPTS